MSSVRQETDDVPKAFDLYYEFDYDLGVRDMEDMAVPQKNPATNGKVGAVGYCLGGKLCYLMCCRTEIDCAVAYYGTYIEHRIKEVKNLHRPFVLHMAMKDRWVQAEVNDMLERRLSPNPLVTIHKYPGADTPSPATAAYLLQARGRPGARADGGVFRKAPRFVVRSLSAGAMSTARQKIWPGPCLPPAIPIPGAQSCQCGVFPDITGDLGVFWAPAR